MLELLKRTGVFLIIAETMYHFVNENKYARYIRLLISMMTMAMIVIPIGSFFTDSGMENFREALVEYENQYFAYVDGSQIQSYGADEYVSETVCEDIAYLCNRALEEAEMAPQIQVSKVILTENQICIVCHSAQGAEPQELTRLFSGVLGVKEALLEVRTDE